MIGTRLGIEYSSVTNNNHIVLLHRHKLCLVSCKTSIDTTDIVPRTQSSIRLHTNRIVVYTCRIFDRDKNCIACARRDIGNPKTISRTLQRTSEPLVSTKLQGVPFRSSKQCTSGARANKKLLVREALCTRRTVSLQDYSICNRLKSKPISVSNRHDTRGLPSVKYDIWLE